MGTYQGFDTEDTGADVMLVGPDGWFERPSASRSKGSVRLMTSNHGVGPGPKGGWVLCGAVKGGAASHMGAYIYRGLHPPMQSNKCGQA